MDFCLARYGHSIIYQKDVIHILVYYEEHKSLQEAIKRERQIKKWKREWKINLIEKSNPEWNDLYNKLPQNNK
jgi:putative endonuclease